MTERLERWSCGRVYRVRTSELVTWLAADALSGVFTLEPFAKPGAGTPGIGYFQPSASSTPKD